jgi:hypothetical protein
MTVIINAASGPGTVTDDNYTGAIELLQGAGIRVLGYIHISEASRAIADVVADVATWKALYPFIDGIWIDEFPQAAATANATDTSGGTITNLQYIQQIRAAAQLHNIDWVFGNQGSPSSYTSVAYLQADVVDKVCIWESATPPAATDLGSTGDWSPSFETTDYSKRIAIVHDQATFNMAEFQIMQQYTGFLYITDGAYTAVSAYLQTMLQYLGQSVASATQPGVVKVGANLTAAIDGTLTLTDSITLAGDLTVRDIFAAANSIHIGGVQLSTASGALTITDSANNATLFTITDAGVVSAPVSFATPSIALSAGTATTGSGTIFRTTAATPTPSGNYKVVVDDYLYATRVYSTVWNDIADFIEVQPELEVEFGRVYVMNEDGTYAVAPSYNAEGIIGIASDTFGFGVGQKDETINQVPIAIGGFVLAFVDAVYRTGTALTTDRYGGLTVMTKQDKMEYPERIVATFWKPETEAIWNGISVNGRHWVKVR